MTVHDWGEDDVPFMVLELLEGGSLRGMLDRGTPGGFGRNDADEVLQDAPAPEMLEPKLGLDEMRPLSNRPRPSQARWYLCRSKEIHRQDLAGRNRACSRP